jgi:hypothetical protein
MQAGNQGEQAITPLPEPFRLPSGQPTALLLIKSDEPEVQLAMPLLVRMVARMKTLGTLTLVQTRGTQVLAPTDKTFVADCTQESAK